MGVSTASYVCKNSKDALYQARINLVVFKIEVINKRLKQNIHL